jgi:Family of unknown function (DUF6185)
MRPIGGVAGIAAALFVALAKGPTAAAQPQACDFVVSHPLAIISVSSTLFVERVEEQPDPVAVTLVQLPAHSSLTAGLVDHATSSRAYRSALVMLLGRTGVFDEDALGEIEGYPRVTLHRGRAWVLIRGRPAPWSTSPDGARDTVQIAVPADVPSTMRITARVRVAPARLRAFSSPPDEEHGGRAVWRLQGARRPSVVGASLDIAAHQSVLTRIGNRDGGWLWLYPLDPFLAIVLVLFLVPWALRGPSDLVPLPAGEARRARTVVRLTLLFGVALLFGVWLQQAGFDLPLRSLHRWAGHVPRQATLTCAIAAAVVGLELGALRRPRAVLFAAVVSAGLALLFAMGAASARNLGRGLDEGGVAAVLSLGLGAALLVYIAATPTATPRRRAFVAALVWLAGTVAASIAAEAGASDRAFLVGLRAQRWTLAVALIGFVLLTLALVVALWAAIVCLWRGAGYDLRPRTRRWLGVAGVFIALALVAQQLESWRRFVGRDQLSGPLMFRQSFWNGPVYYDFIRNFPFTLVSAALTVTVFVALAVLLAVIRTAGVKATNDYVDLRGWLVRSLALLFAGFVVGTGGSLRSVNISVPVAFVIALMIVFRLPRPPATPAVFRAKPEDPPPAGAVISSGPAPTWWENGLAAVQVGAVLAIVPVGYYLYVFFSRLGHTFAFDVGYRFVGALTGIAGELAVWLVAALVFGILYPHLPGRNGLVKGLVLGSVYLVASLAAVALHESYDVQWQFRAFEFLLFMSALGVAVDGKSLRSSHRSWKELADVYQVHNVRAVAPYAVPVVLSVIVVAQQLLSGDAHDAIISIIKGFSGAPRPGG